MDFQKYKAFIFDLDGTLYDNAGFAKALVLSAPFSAFKMRAERIARRELWGRDDENCETFKKNFYQRAAFRAKCDFSKYQKWYEGRYLKIFSKTLCKKKFHAREKVSEIFSALNSKGKKIAIYSDYENVAERMASCGISEDAVKKCGGLFSAVEFGCLKPAPRGFLQIASKLGAAPKECLVVGDRDDTDGQGARFAGMDFVKIKTHSDAAQKEGCEVMEWSEFADSVLNAANDSANAAG